MESAENKHGRRAVWWCRTCDTEAQQAGRAGRKRVKQARAAKRVTDKQADLRRIYPGLPSAVLKHRQNYPADT
jgi:hypothetical protein